MGLVKRSRALKSFPHSWECGNVVSEWGRVWGWRSFSHSQECGNVVGGKERGGGIGDYGLGKGIKGRGGRREMIFDFGCFPAVAGRRRGFWSGKCSRKGLEGRELEGGRM